MGLFDKAEIYFKKALDIFPSHILSLQNLGQLYLDTQRYDMALPLYKKILKKDPKNIKVHFNIGVCYEKTGKIETARKFFKQVIALNPKSDLAKNAREKLALLGE
jgi:tetratricopeptide (TPR) repeat protein